ncbi:hypothetical protein [Ekhidna sp.]|uniref:hypothetical protein n=1 Tax=Ekhidna sp. TaxID=2608089 RepID=UPI003BAD11F6
MKKVKFLFFFKPSSGIPITSKVTDARITLPWKSSTDVSISYTEFKEGFNGNLKQKKGSQIKLPFKY